MNATPRETVGYRVLLPVTLPDDELTYEPWLTTTLDDLPMLVGLPGGVERWRTDRDTVTAQWWAYRPPVLDAIGVETEPERSQRWHEGQPVPPWALGLMLTLTAEVVREDAAAVPGA